MKNLTLLVWVSQLGLSTALPLCGFVFLGIWLRNVLHWGTWVIIAGVILGLICAVQGLRGSLRSMELLAKKEKEEDPPVSFNEHQ